MKLCDYGCGEEAHYQFKNGKGCCKEKWEFCCSSKIRAKEKANIQWSSHKSRHFFKSQIWTWMRENKQVDPGLVKDLMGHKKTVTEIYGPISWDYKCGMVDKVFG